MRLSAQVERLALAGSMDSSSVTTGGKSEHRYVVACSWWVGSRQNVEMSSDYSFHLSDLESRLLAEKDSAGRAMRSLRREEKGCQKV